MKIKKLLIGIGIFVFFASMVVLPLVMMYRLSQSEMENYQLHDSYTFREAAYGEVKSVTRQDLELYYTFSGTVTSSSYRYVDIPEKDQADVIANIAIGDEVFKGQVIVSIGTSSVTAPCDGIVEDISSFAGGYVKLRTFEQLQLSCPADLSVINSVRDSQSLKLEDGSRVWVESVSNIVEDGQGKIVFSVENADYMYGQEVKDLKIYTGKSYTDVLTLDKDCVYQKEADGSYFVRVVDENHYLVDEMEIEIGFEAEEVVGVLNIDEGTLCDSGYKELLKSRVE